MIGTTGVLGDWLIKHQLFHGIVLAIARPQISLIQNSCGRNQGITQFHPVAFAILAHIFASLTSGLVGFPINRKIIQPLVRTKTDWPAWDLFKDYQ
jgi:hypothetical protein